VSSARSGLCSTDTSVCAPLAPGSTPLRRVGDVAFSIWGIGRSFGLWCGASSFSWGCSSPRSAIVKGIVNSASLFTRHTRYPRPPRSLAHARDDKPIVCLGWFVIPSVSEESGGWSDRPRNRGARVMTQTHVRDDRFPDGAGCGSRFHRAPLGLAAEAVAQTEVSVPHRLGGRSGRRSTCHLSRRSAWIVLIAFWYLATRSMSAGVGFGMRERSELSVRSASLTSRPIGFAAARRTKAS
jgi:hypothetical protein